MNRKKIGGLIKKSAAVVLSMVMVMGAVSVMPESVISDNAIVAHAAYDSFTANGCSFTYYFLKQTDKSTIILTDAEILNAEGKVEIPAKVTIDNVEYEVTNLADRFLENNGEIKTLIMPDTITKIGHSVLEKSTVESITFSNNLENLGYGAFMYCNNLKYENVKFSGTKLKKAAAMVFVGSPGMVNEKGAICLGPCLLSYTQKEPTASIKIADLGNNGIKINCIADRTFSTPNDVLTTVDLEGVKYIGDNNFNNYTNLKNVINENSLEELGKDAVDRINIFEGTEWRNSSIENKGYVKLNKFLLYYFSEGNVIDLRPEEFSDITEVERDAFKDCANADTLFCSSKVHFNNEAFYKVYDNSETINSVLPEKAVHKIKNIYVDGKKMEFTKDNPQMNEWLYEHYFTLKATEWIKVNTVAKTKVLFDQMDINYYGPNNNKKGTLSPTEEFYIMLKIHEYMSTYEADSALGGVFFRDFLFLGRANCSGYEGVTSYLLECAGVNYLSYSSHLGLHTWNQVQIGDEWFECDMGWDEQLGHNYGWFALSTTKVAMRDEVNKSHAHDHDSYTTDWDGGKKNTAYNDDVPRAKRTLGDLNNDEQRDDKDVELLWDYIKGNTSGKKINADYADINFDGVVDITDGVLLENFVYGTSVDPNNFPKDTLSPGFNVVFADNCDPKDIDPNYFIYDFTDRDGYIILPESEFKAPKGMKFAGWDYGKEGKVGKVGEKVKISNPYTVVQPIWKDASELDDDDDSKSDDDSKGDDDSKSDNDSKGDDSSKPDTEGKWLLGDVDGNGVIDIGDISMLINHINGVKALDKDAMLRADVNKSNTVDISDASTIVNHINGVKALEGKV